MIKFFLLPGDREAIKNTVKLKSFFFLDNFLFNFFKKLFSDAHFDRRNYFLKKSKPTKHSNQPLSVFSSAECFCVREIYEHFKFDGANFLGPQSLKENCFGKLTSTFEWSRKWTPNQRKLKNLWPHDFFGKVVGPSRQFLWAGLFFGLLIVNFTGSQGRTFL